MTSPKATLAFEDSHLQSTKNIKNADLNADLDNSGEKSVILFISDENEVASAKR